jgi:hypothetical protein
MKRKVNKIQALEKEIELLKKEVLSQKIVIATLQNRLYTYLNNTGNKKVCTCSFMPCRCRRYDVFNTPTNQIPLRNTGMTAGTYAYHLNHLNK